MSTWLPIVVLIVVVFAAGLLRERFRVSGIERWAKAKVKPDGTWRNRRRRPRYVRVTVP